MSRFIVRTSFGTAALVLSIKLRQMPLPARLRKQLATSWVVANMLSSLKRSAPRRKGHGT